ncbi:MAG: hypothetical protein HUU55_16435 [Myxococcales bacterium]|nr:hypothetical protein [Myxococcales bacterium]
MAQQSSTKVDVTKLAPFRFRNIDGDVLVVSEWGDWMWMTRDEFDTFSGGRIKKDHEIYNQLYRSRLVSDALTDNTVIEAVRQRKVARFSGPSVHTVILCDQQGDLMPGSTLNRALDTAFLSTNPNLEFRFCSNGRRLPLPLIHEATAYIRRKNQLAQKNCTMVYLDIPTLIEPESIEKFAELGVSVRAVIIDPSTSTETFLQRVEALAKLQLEWRKYQHTNCEIAAVCIPGQRNVADYSDWIDTIVDVGCTSFTVRRGDILDVWSDPQHYSRLPSADFLKVYNDSVRKFIEKSTKDRPIIEKSAADAFSRILRHVEPKHPITSNPSTAGIGELAFGPGGEVFVSYNGFRATKLGVQQFQVGHLPEHGYHDLMSHPTVRSLVMATTLEGQAGWAESAYLPFSGVCPVLSYLEQGSISGRMPDSDQTRQTFGILDSLFRLIRSATDTTNVIIQSWIDSVV